MPESQTFAAQVSVEQMEEGNELAPKFDDDQDAAANNETVVG